MDQYNKIQQKILSLPADFKIETIFLNEALNRILQEDIIADMPMPPFNKSAMDGYACRLKDIANKLEILEVLQAGDIPSREIGANQCSKIMTGAAVPDGADCVFMVEHSEMLTENSVLCTNPKTNKNICYQGEDYQVNEVLIKKGTIVSVSHMAVMAGAGYKQVKVSVQPKIGLINTGSELVEPHEKPAYGQIRNSNASQLIAQLKKMNLAVNNYGIVEDNYEKHVEILNRAISENDILFFTGGASVGDFDLVPKILNDLNFEIFWDRTGIKPGNPMSFSKKGKNYCFGLSGNPVSSLMQFEFIAKPVLYRLMGANFKAIRIKAELGFDYFRKKADRLGIVPVVINSNGIIDRIPFNGSAHINSLVFANAFLEVPLQHNQLKKGDFAYVRPI